MQEQHQRGLVPVLTSRAGSCLTFANWQAAGISLVSVYLTDLLMKPGYAFLDRLASIKDYYQWPGHIVLNATLPPANHEDSYTLRSRYDGSKITIHRSKLIALINQLQPDTVILPLGSHHDCQQLSNTIMPYYSLNESIDASDRAIGRYLTIDCDTPFIPKQLGSEPLYVIGNVNRLSPSINAFLANYFVESDKPAVDGLNGLIYSREGTLNILNDSMRNEHRLLDDNCQCQTCQSSFTRSYLHHLLQQTPLLAQRYLIQHNAWFCQNYSIT